jgi:hypothetical protein
MVRPPCKTPPTLRVIYKQAGVVDDHVAATENAFGDANGDTHIGNAKSGPAFVRSQHKPGISAP